MNWYFLLAGVLVLYFGLSNTSIQNNSGLRVITITLSNDITNIKGHRSSTDYKFWTLKYPNSFHVLNGGISKGKHNSISTLKKGQEIQIWITENDHNKLGIKSEDISVKGIKLNGNYLMSKKEYFENRKMYNTRLKVLSIFAGMMLLINGFSLISNKTNYLAITIFIGMFFLMRVFDFGLY